jgi:NAD+ synthase
MYNFDPNTTIADIGNWLRDLQKKSRLKKVVIGISGGKDSAVAAALCCRAFGKEHVYGLLMPNGEQPDIDDSRLVCASLRIVSQEIPISAAYQEILRAVGDISREARINIAPRLRMTILYTWGQTHHCRVCGTGNLSEIMLGYFTKHGDGASDFNPLADLTSVEVVEIGRCLSEIPTKIVEKTPQDGLCGMSDEENLGISYQTIHNYIRKTGDEISQRDLDKIIELERKGMHKRIGIPSPFEFLWFLM